MMTQSQMDAVLAKWASSPGTTELVKSIRYWDLAKEAQYHLDAKSELIEDVGFDTADFMDAVILFNNWADYSSCDFIPEDNEEGENQ